MNIEHEYYEATGQYEPFEGICLVDTYVYAVLHHSQYRERYAANLRRELPRIPFVGAEVTRLTSKPSAHAADAASAI